MKSRGHIFVNACVSVCVCVGGRYFSLIWNRTNDHSRCRWWLWMGSGRRRQTQGNLRHMFPSQIFVSSPLMEACQLRPKSNRVTISRLSQVVCVSFAGHGLDTVWTRFQLIFATFSRLAIFGFLSSSGSLLYSLSSAYLFNLLVNLLILFFFSFFRRVRGILWVLFGINQNDFGIFFVLLFYALPSLSLSPCLSVSFVFLHTCVALGGRGGWNTRIVSRVYGWEKKQTNSQRA